MVWRSGQQPHAHVLASQRHSQRHVSAVTHGPLHVRMAAGHPHVTERLHTGEIISPSGRIDEEAREDPGLGLGAAWSPPCP